MEWNGMEYEETGYLVLSLFVLFSVRFRGRYEVDWARTVPTLVRR